LRDEEKMKKANYGIDEPRAVLLFIIFAIIGVGGIATITVLPDITGQIRLINIAGSLLFFAAWGLCGTGVFIWSSKYGKLQVRDKIIGSIPWRGDETVLDVGCVRGLMLIGAAKRLNSGGKAVGIHIWNPGDQSGNRPEATLENSRVEGVADRTELKTGDARKLPFPSPRLM
jgi:hypothetical protein